MRILLGLIILAVIVIIVLTLIKIGEKLLQDHSENHAHWRVSPRTDEDNNARTIWLLCEGERDFMFWPTEGNVRWDFDRAMMEAEIVSRELNRQKKELAA